MSAAYPGLEIDRSTKLWHPSAKLLWYQEPNPRVFESHNGGWLTSP